MNTQEQKSSLHDPKYGYGYININDTCKNIPPVYPMAKRFSDKLAAVIKDDKWGYIDAQNNLVIDYQFDVAKNFKHGLAIVKQGHFFGVIDKQGKYVIKPVYYDLQEVEIAGKMYYISRNESVLSGLIDSRGNNVIPNQFSYIVKLADLYEHVPLYAYRETDATTGVIELFDSKFNLLVSRHSSGYNDGFQTYEYQRINTYLKEKVNTPLPQKRKDIARLLVPPETLADSPSAAYEAMTEDEVSKHVRQLGYRLFAGEEGRVGLKKGETVMIPAVYDAIMWVNAVIIQPDEADMEYLHEHYCGWYRNKEEGVFIVFGLRAVFGDHAHFFTPSGKKLISLKAGRKVITGFIPFGIEYTQLEKNDDDKLIGKSGMINWKGQELLPPVFKSIDFLEEGYLYVTKEIKADGEFEKQYALYSKSGEEIIQPDAFTKMQPLTNAVNLYLAEQRRVACTHEENDIPPPSNTDGFVVSVANNSYTVIQQFTTDDITGLELDPETGMLMYGQIKEC